MPFTKENEYYIDELAKEDVPTKLVIGSKTGKFVPNINASKWNDEAWLNINSPVVVTDEEAKVDKDKISQTIGDYTFNYYTKPDGTLEHEIVLAKKPPSSKFSFDIDFPDGLEFWFQPPLTQKEIDTGFKRPDNVVGSYAVYWSKSNNQYKTGKFCHIYRPQLIDAAGDKIWAELNIDPKSKTLTISVDPAWLDKAKFPVMIDPTFGYSTIGASSQVIANYDMATFKTTTTEAGTITAIHCWCCNNDTSTHHIKLALYNDISGVPSSRVGSTVEIALTNGEGYPNGVDKSASDTGTLVASTKYWFAKNIDAQIAVFYDTVTNSSVYSFNAYASALPDPWALSTTLYDHQHSIWVDYTAGGETITADKWHPQIEQPVREKIEVIGY